ncbi:DUF6069 family protein [Agromyces sp. NPDC058064]|uniref:DUF6069 family protein n=1 Tax=Agromyces sp. NPDC058064 TaxID=3346322 RepID=UPI0036DE33CB
MNTTTRNLPPNTTADHVAANAPTSGRRRVRRAAAVAVAILLPLLVGLVATALFGLDLIVGAGPTAQTVTAASIVVAGFVGGSAAWGVLALLERFVLHAHRIFAVVGWTLLGLSLLGPIGAGASGGVLIALIAMHLTTGAALLVGLPLAARPHGAGRR